MQKKNYNSKQMLIKVCYSRAKIYNINKSKELVLIRNTKKIYIVIIKAFLRMSVKIGISNLPSRFIFRLIF